MVIHVGTSPAGISWGINPREGESAESIACRVAIMTARLQSFHAKAAAREAAKAAAVPVESLDTTETPQTIEQLRARYEAAKRNYFLWRGRTHTKAFNSAYTKAQKDHYREQASAASDKLLIARVALRKAERRHGRN